MNEQLTLACEVVRLDSRALIRVFWKRHVSFNTFGYG
jgi:hypothetical protein